MAKMDDGAALAKAVLKAGQEIGKAGMDISRGKSIGDTAGKLLQKGILAVSGAEKCIENTLESIWGDEVDIDLSDMFS